MNKRLAKMIECRETELQRAYDNLMSEQEEIKSWIRGYEKELKKKEDRLLFINGMIENCKRRAIEQNCLEVL